PRRSRIPGVPGRRAIPGAGFGGAGTGRSGTRPRRKGGPVLVRGRGREGGSDGSVGRRRPPRRRRPGRSYSWADSPIGTSATVAIPTGRSMGEGCTERPLFGHSA